MRTRFAGSKSNKKRNPFLPKNENKNTNLDKTQSSTTLNFQSYNYASPFFC